MGISFSSSSGLVLFIGVAGGVIAYMKITRRRIEDDSGYDSDDSYEDLDSDGAGITQIDDASLDEEPLDDIS